MALNQRNERKLEVVALAFIAAAVVLLASLAVARSASATTPPTALPPCPTPGDVGDEILVEWPKLLAWKRRVPVALEADNAEGFLELWVGDQFAGSVDPRDGDDKTDYAPFWVRADPGDQEVPIRFRYGSTDRALPPNAGPNCYREASRVIPAAKGRILRYGTRYKRRDALLDFEAPHTFLSISGCAPYAVVPAVLRVRAAGRTRSLVLADQCRDHQGKELHGKGWTATTFNFEGFQQDFWLFLSREALIPRQVIHVSVLAGGKQLVSRTVLVRRRYSPGYRIWEGTDAFVNVCINQGKLIRSSGGRLYCDIPAAYAMSVRIRR